MSLFRIDLIQTRSLYIEAPDKQSAVKQYSGERENRYTEVKHKHYITELTEGTKTEF